MKDIIYYAIIGGLFLFNAIALFRQRKADNLAYKIVYFSRYKDWFLALLIIILVITLLVVVEPFVPKFLKWGLFSLLGKDGTNANIEIIQQSSKVSSVLMIVVFSILILLIPKASYWEEIRFRYNITEFKKSILSNIKFGMAHCLVGVPLWVGMVLILIGFIYTLKYIYEYKKTNDLDSALESSTSLHGKYNTILVGLLIIALLLTA
jgi:hypothetical protein